MDDDLCDGEDKDDDWGGGNDGADEDDNADREDRCDWHHRDDKGDFDEIGDVGGDGETDNSDSRGEYGFLRFSASRFNYFSVSIKL